MYVHMHCGGTCEIEYSKVVLVNGNKSDVDSPVNRSWVGFRGFEAAHSLLCVCVCVCVCVYVCVCVCTILFRP